MFGFWKRKKANRASAGRAKGGRAAVSRAALDRLMASHQARIDARNQAWDREESQFRDLVASTLGGGAFGRFRGLLGHRRELSDLMAGSTTMRARYDSAQTTDDNRSHWGMADALAADAANSPAVRRILRNRSRYEVANNCYAAGVGLTIANDFCGTGPRLNLTTEDEGTNSEVEEKFASWSRAVNLARLLRTMRQARRQDGEAFGLLGTNPGIEDAVKLGLRLVEAECVQSWSSALDPRNADGVHLDSYGNPVAYDVLRAHPGSLGSMGAVQYDTWPRKYVLHWFRPSRPGQHRGIPEILAALPLYATLRRYTQATLDAAETAADVAILLETLSGAEYQDSEGNQQAAEAAGAFSAVPMQRRMMIALPQGYKATQFEPKQPTQVYSNFKREVAGEIGRCENVSRNVVLLDSSESNFASGQLDHRITYRTHDIDRADAEVELLDRVFAAWLDEAALITGYLPQSMRLRNIVVPHTWHWDSNELGDSLKLAKAKAANLASGLTSLPAEYAARGEDWIQALTIAARGYGISVEELQALIRQSVFSTKVDSAEGGTAAGAEDREAAHATAE